METEKEIIKALKRQEEMLNQIHLGFTKLCLQLGVLAERLEDDVAEDDMSELPFPEQIQYPTMGKNS